MSEFPLSDHVIDDSDLEPSIAGEEETSQAEPSPQDEAALSEPVIGLSPVEQYITELSLVLFDQTASLHGLDLECRKALEILGPHLEVQIPHARKKPYQAVLNYLASQTGFTYPPELEPVIAASLAMYQGKIKPGELDHFEISPIQQRQIITLVALLKIAAGLNDSKSNQTIIQKVEINQGEVWIEVDGPQAVSDAAVAQHKTTLWKKIGYPRIEILEAKEAALWRLPYPETAEKAGILPTDSLAEAGRKVMCFQFAQMLKNEPGTRLGEDIEALHDMRVATRRMRASFEVFESAFEPGALKPYLKGLRATGRALGAVRDLDVFMEKAGIYLKTLPDDHQHDLDLLLNAWREQREAARTQMLSFLDSQEYREFKRKFNIFLNTPGAGARQHPMEQPTPALVCELAPVLIYSRWAEVRSFSPFMRDATVEQFHALRIEFKKFRYTVEYFREVLGKSADEVIADLKKVQDHLGDLNDAQVAGLILREFIDTWEPRQEALPVQERVSFEPLLQYLTNRHAEKHQLMQSFKDTWMYINRPGFRRYLAQAVAVL